MYLLQSLNKKWILYSQTAEFRYAYSTRDVCGCVQRQRTVIGNSPAQLPAKAGLAVPATLVRTLATLRVDTDSTDTAGNEYRSSLTTSISIHRVRLCRPRQSELCFFLHLSYIFRSGTFLTALRILFFLLVRKPLQKSQGSVVSNRIGVEFGRNVLHLNTRRLTGSVFDLRPHFQDDGRDVVSHRKVLPSGECTHNVCLSPMQQRSPVPDLHWNNC